MGTQQLLMVVIGVVLVGLMIAVAMELFRDHSAATNRDALGNDLIHAATAAQSYWRRPRVLGGGGGTFQGFDLRVAFSAMANTNGTFAVVGSPSDSLITIQAIGTEPGFENTSQVELNIRVFKDRTELQTIN
jgi:hypothetical protein